MIPDWVQRKLQSPNARQRRSAMYYARKYIATPAWADKRRIGQIYREAQRRSTAVRRFVVDHIVPLSHPRVCGLHCPDNLQIVLDQENQAKCNHWWPDMPERQEELPLDCCINHQLELL